jgi:hypothetical protein
MLYGSCATFCRRPLQCWGGGGLRAIATSILQFLCINLIVCSVHVVSCCFSLFNVEAWVFLMCRSKYCTLLVFASCCLQPLYC